MNDAIIFEAVSAKLGDFDAFKREVVSALERH